MDYALRIQLSSVEGAVVRALGLIERRGYSLLKCTLGESDGTGRNLHVNVSSYRSGELLKRQLERLHDVFHVELLPVTAAGSNKQTGIRSVNRRI